MSFLSDLADNMITALDAGMTAATEWVNGTPPDVMMPQSVQMGYVWAEKIVPDSKSMYEAEFTVGVRVYAIPYEVQDPTQPTDPSPLYQIVDDVAAVAAANSQSDPFGGSAWDAHMTQVDVDHDNQLVDWTFQITTWNAAQIGSN